MELEHLLNFISIEDQRLNQHYGVIDQDKRCLARTVKLAEEFGELCNEVLAHSSLQRADKLANFDINNLSEEFADVIITTLLLAKTMDIDIEEAIEKKMEKINKRYQ